VVDVAPGMCVNELVRLVLIPLTSPSHMIMNRNNYLVPNINGIFEEGLVPSLFGYDAGHVGVGDIFEWFVEHGIATVYKHNAKVRGISAYQLLEEEVAKLKPGESGLLALDWWNGCRTPLMEAKLSGMLLGTMLGTRA
jgi:L-ribulokinase